MLASASASAAPLGRAPAAADVLAAATATRFSRGARQRRAIEPSTTPRPRDAAVRHRGRRRAHGSARSSVDRAPARSAPTRLLARADARPRRRRIDGPTLDAALARARSGAARAGYYEASVVARRRRAAGDGARRPRRRRRARPARHAALRGRPDSRGAPRRAGARCEREATVDEDLLEDSKRRIERCLQEPGPLAGRVRAIAASRPSGRLDIVFHGHARRGIHRIAERRLDGQQRAVAQAEVEALMAAASRRAVRRIGARRARRPALVERYGAAASRRAHRDQALAERRRRRRPRPSARVGWRCALRRHRGPADAGRHGARSTGNAACRTPSVARPRCSCSPAGRSTSRCLPPTARRSAVYLDRGFDRAPRRRRPRESRRRRRADITFTVVEGEQVLVDRVLIVGNRRTSTATIERALTLKPGEPLGLAELLESQRRLRALGLFRRVTHHRCRRARRDAARSGRHRRGSAADDHRLRRAASRRAATCGRTRSTGRRPSGSSSRPAASSRSAAATCGASNRSVNLFTRVSLRPTTVPEAGRRATSFGFNEYRVLATLPRAERVRDGADAHVTGYFEQAVRSSFNFVRRGVQAELARRLRGAAQPGRRATR